MENYDNFDILNMPIEEFDESTKSEAASIRSNLGRAFEHLLKLRYRKGSDMNDQHWRNEINAHLNKVLKNTKYESTRSKTNVIKLLESDLDEIFIDGINYYTKDIPRYNGILPYIKGYIDEVCPWTFKELMDNCKGKDKDGNIVNKFYIGALLSKLPNLD